MADDSITPTTALTRTVPSSGETFPERFVKEWWSQSGGSMVGVAIGAGTAATFELATAALTYLLNTPPDLRAIALAIGGLGAICIGSLVGKSAADAAQSAIDSDPDKIKRGMDEQK